MTTILPGRGRRGEADGRRRRRHNGGVAPPRRPPMPPAVRRSCLAVAALLAVAAGARADLAGYVSKPDATFAWKLVQKIDHPDGVIYDLELTSQTWQDITWKHQLQIYQPKGVAPSK